MIEGTILFNTMMIAAIGLVLIVLIIILARRKHRPDWYRPHQSPSDIVGIIGEKEAREKIRKILFRSVARGKYGAFAPRSTPNRIQGET